MISSLSNPENNIRVVFLCSPGNPTATLLKEEDIIKVLQVDFKGIVVVDEAYIDFAGPNKSMCRYLSKYRNLVVLQTCSKSFGLAGIRCGFAFGDKKLIEIINNVKAPYNMNKFTTHVAIEAFKSIDKVMSSVSLINAERDRVMASLSKIKQVGKVHRSDANFILFEVKNAYAVYKKMADNKVVIRYRGKELHCNDCLRATIGKEIENNAMLALLTKYAGELDV